jgi:hypothetical protein
MLYVMLIHIKVISHKFTAYYKITIYVLIKKIKRNEILKKFNESILEMN